MVEKKMNDDTEMNVGMLEDALIDTLKEVTIKFSKDSYICRILTDTIHLINRQKGEIERLTEKYEDKLAWQEVDIQQLTEEKAELQKQVDELKEELKQSYKQLEEFEDMRDKAIEVCDNCHKKYAKKIEQAEKDTAKEILEELDLFFKGTTFRKGYEFKKIDKKLKEIAKCKGVEVE